MSKRAFDAKRQNLWMFDPEELRLAMDKDDPLYDVRGEEPPDERLVRNIMYHGVLEPVVIVKRPEGPTVVDGRRRVVAAREASERLVEQGGDGVKVPCVLRRGSEGALAAVMVSTNEIRKDDTVLNRADKAQRLLDLGKTLEEVAEIFGKSVQTIKNWLDVAGLASPVRKLVEAGKLAANDAAKLKDLARAEQVEAAQKLAETNGRQRAKRNGKNGARKSPVKHARMRTAAEIKAKLAKGKLSADYEEALKWVLRV